MSGDFLISLFRTALAAVAAERRLPSHLPPPPVGRTVVIGAGKAAAAMARAVETHWPGPLSGMVVTRYGHGIPCDRIDVVEAAHPIPDSAGEAAARRILDSVQGLGDDDLVLVLLSGGGSALLALPAPGVDLDDKRALSAALLRSGAPIHEINCVRKHLSAIKGGRLAVAAFPARVVALAVSDVAGDDPTVIASGPVVADPTTLGEARGILRHYGIFPSAAVAGALADPANETPKPGDSRLARSEVRVVARAQDALEAAAEDVRREGLKPVLLGDAVEGEARSVARDHAALAMEAPQGTVLLSGGETTVRVEGGGRGGPNTEYALALAMELDGAPGIRAIACDTDGIDGSENNAGAVIGPDTLARAATRGLNPRSMLADNDSYGFFSALGDLVVTGPTLTNVNDFRAILIERA